MNRKDRRKFIKNTGITIGALAVAPGILSCGSKTEQSTEGDHMEMPSSDNPPWSFDISLAEWSFHRALNANEFTNLEFPLKTKELGINAVEYVSSFFRGKVTDSSYLQELNGITDNNGIRNVLIMVDGEGGLGDTDFTNRNTAVDNHHKWVDAAKYLGCHSIRVNAYGRGTSEEVSDAAIDGLGKLCEYGAQNEINIIVENHGGYSSNGKWLTNVIEQVNNPYCGTLPDFGNFKIADNEFYDHYQGIEEMMKYAKGVSAKGHNFDFSSDSFICTGSGNVETGTIDFERMLKIVKAAGYTGYIGIEYEGSQMPESENIAHIRKILEELRQKLA